ncbi:unnamed protein product, partial [Brassica rapa subsp. narinosa]
MLKLHGCRKLKLKLLFPTSALQHRSQSLAISYIGSSTQVPKLSSFLSWEGPREQRNQLFSVLGSLTDPEEEESKDSSEVNSMRNIKLPRRRSLQVELSCNSLEEKCLKTGRALAFRR